MVARRLAWVCLFLAACGGGGGGDEDGGTARDTSTSACTSDLECDDGLWCNGAERCDPGASGADADGCVTTTAPCDADLGCNEREDRCNECVDGDGDGELPTECGGTDCDDTNDAIGSEQSEVCDVDGVDEDCDSTTFGNRDVDRDGFVDILCCNGETCGNDCDDAAANVHPTASEACDMLDNDCDGNVDETVSTFSFWPDCDGDDFGDRDATAVIACATPAASVPCESGGTWVMTGMDCDDAVAATNPGATERCNTTDDDCDGSTDEEIEIVDWYPDCDDDGYGDGTGTPVSGCAEPSELATCGTGGWADRAGDCADTNASRNPGATEVCNAIDDDCDTLVDDIDDGIVICRRGETRACDNTCGVGGTQTCTLACDGFGACSSAATEVCNYCDDDGDGLADDAALAVFPRGAELRNCAAVFGDATCGPRGGDPSPSPPFFFDATVMDGRGDDRSGAVWLNPSDWVQGYGTVVVDVTMRLRGHPENSSHMIQSLHGGWALLVSTSGDPGVGSPRQLGIPGGHDGLALRWHWNTRITSPGDEFLGNDSLSLLSLPGSLRRPSGSDPVFWDDRTGVDVPNGTNAADFGGETSIVSQRVRLAYTPDDPRTPLVNEERVQVFVGNSNAVAATWAAADGYAQSPRNEILPGNRFRIGITAGTYSESGQFYIPSGFTVGMPVEATVQLWRLSISPIDGEVYDGFQATVSSEGLCR